jgi:2-dehydro-3-deoxygluconokinase
MAQHIIVGECMVEMSSRGQQLYYQTFAGDTYNTAVYFKRCNSVEEVKYLTAIGNDDISQGLLEQMQHEGLATDLTLRSPDKTLGLYMINTDEKGERSFAYWRSDSAAKQIMSLLDPASLGQPKSFFLSGISLAIVSDQDKQALLDLATTLKQQGCCIIFDPNYRPQLWQSAEHARVWTDKAYALADIAFPGCDDHKALYGHLNLTEVQQHVAALGVQEMVIKNGEHGIQIFSHGQHCIVPAHRVTTVVDTTAAGDAFNGGYLAARFAGQNEQSAAGFAAKIAAYVIGHRGAIVDKTDMSVFIKANVLW